MRKFSFIILSLLFVSLFSFNGQAAKIKVACIGNSITGFHEYTYYATPLQAMLGDDYQVDNFGKGGSGIFKKFREDLGGIEPEFAYINSSQCTDAVNFKPDIVIIKFGANDANMKNFTMKDENGKAIDGKQVFKDDYTLLINKFRALSSNPRVIICIPPAMFYPTGNIKDSITGSFLGGFSSEAMHKYIRPAVKELAQELNVGIADFYTPTKLHPEFMPGDTGGWAPDWVHPDHRGHYVMALAAYEAVMGKPYERPFVEGEFVPDPEKEYYIRNKQTGKVLQVKEETAYAGVIVADVNINEDLQLFKFENFSTNIYRIRQPKTNGQLVNRSSQVLNGKDPHSEPLKYGFYINHVSDGYYTISNNDEALLGARASQSTTSIAGNKKQSSISNLDLWEFVEKDAMQESSVKTAHLKKTLTVKSGEKKILIENLTDISKLNIYDLTGKVLMEYNVTSSSLAVNLMSGMYILSTDNSDFKQTKVIVK